MSTTSRRLDRDGPDEVLLAAAIGGDQLAFDDLVSRHLHAAVRVARGIVGSNQAMDVVNNARLLAHRALGSLTDPTRFSRWFMAITRWVALRAGKLKGRQALWSLTLNESVLETLSRLAADPRQSDAGDRLLLETLEKIPAMYAEVIRYHVLHDLTQQKIAEFLNLPLSTIKWRCFRGKEILRCTLSPEPTCPTVCRKGCAKYPNE
jgi:RNA polymerase sigma-70 factor (ECF subfamily)